MFNDFVNLASYCLKSIHFLRVLINSYQMSFRLSIIYDLQKFIKYLFRQLEFDFAEFNDFKEFMAINGLNSCIIYENS